MFSSNQSVPGLPDSRAHVESTSPNSKMMEMRMEMSSSRSSATERVAENERNAQRNRGSQIALGATDGSIFNPFSAGKDNSNSRHHYLNRKDERKGDNGSDSLRTVTNREPLKKPRGVSGVAHMSKAQMRQAMEDLRTAGHENAETDRRKNMSKNKTSMVASQVLSHADDGGGDPRKWQSTSQAFNAKLKQPSVVHQINASSQKDRAEISSFNRGSRVPLSLGQNYNMKNERDALCEHLMGEDYTADDLNRTIDMIEKKQHNMIIQMAQSKSKC
jgi:hypothetical protein